MIYSKSGKFLLLDGEQVLECPDMTAAQMTALVKELNSSPEVTSIEFTQTVPKKVTMAQARLCLLGSGILGTVDAVIQSLSGPQGDAARIEWEYRDEVRRDSPLISALSGTLGLTDENLDSLFIAAEKI